MDAQFPESAYVQDERDVEQTLEGDSGSFTNLVTRHFRLAFSIALAAVGDRESAEEVTQEAFARAYLNLGQLREKRTFAAWLGGICRNIGRDWVRKGQRRSLALPLVTLKEIPVDISDPRALSARDILVRAEEQKLLGEAILRLQPELREIVLLHYSQELSKSEIARLLKLHPSTVGRHLDRAHTELRRELEPALKVAAKALQPGPAALKRTTAFVAALAGLSAAEKLAVAKALGGSTAAAASSAAAESAAGGALAAGAKPLVIAALLLAGAFGVYWTLNAPDPPAVQARPRTSATAGSPAVAPAEIETEPPTLSSREESTDVASLVPAETEVRPPARNAPADSVTTGTLKVAGRLVNSDGAPLAGAAVTVMTSEQVHTPPDPAARTGSWGEFEVEVAPNVTVGLKTRLAGYTDGYADDIRVRSAPVSDVMITVGAVADVGGTVTDPQGTPMADAEVTLWEEFDFLNQSYGSGIAVVRTDSAGRFQLEKVPSRKELKLFAEMSGFAGSPGTMLTLHSGEQRSDVRLTLRAPHWLEGKVTDAAGKALAGITVAADKASDSVFRQKTAKTGPDGRYRLEELPDGPLRVNAGSDTVPWESFRNIKVDRRDADLVLGKQDPALGKLMGRVIDAHTGAPVTEYKVSGSLYQVKQDEADPSRFTAINLRPEKYEIRIAAVGYAPYLGRIIDIRAGETVEETFELAVGGALLGRLVDGESGKPVPRVAVRIYPFQGSGFLASNAKPLASATTDAEGNFALEGVPAGRQDVKVEPEAAWAGLTREVMMPQSGVLDLGDVSLSRGNTLTGRLLMMPGGQGVAGASIEVHAQSHIGHPVYPARTDAHGAFEIHSLPNGRIKVRVPAHSVEGYAAIKEGTPTDITLQIGTGRLRGRVTTGGQPVQARISLHPAGHGPMQMLKTETDTSGTYALHSIPPGTWTVIAHKNNPMKGEKSDFTVQAGGVVERDFVLPEP